MRLKSTRGTGSIVDLNGLYVNIWTFQNVTIFNVTNRQSFVYFNCLLGSPQKYFSRSRDLLRNIAIRISRFSGSRFHASLHLCHTFCKTDPVIQSIPLSYYPCTLHKFSPCKTWLPYKKLCSCLVRWYNIKITSKKSSRYKSIYDYRNWTGK